MVTASRDFKIRHVNMLGQKVKCAMNHSHADIGHIVICGNNHGQELRFDFFDSFQQRKAIYFRHIDINQSDIDIRIKFNLSEGLLAIEGKHQLISLQEGFPGEALYHQVLQILLIIYKNYFRQGVRAFSMFQS